MTGPNSGPGHNSLLVYVEGQIDYAVSGITTILRDNLRYLDVREDVQRRYNERIQKRLTKTTWMSGCSSWYLTEDGFNASMYPGFATQYLRQMRDFRFGDYDAVEHATRTVHAVHVSSLTMSVRQAAAATGGGDLDDPQRSASRATADPQRLPRRHRDRGVAAVRRGRAAARRSRRPASTASRSSRGMAGTTTRNIRVYRDRGLLHPPLRVGPDRAVQRHPPDPAAADHLAARPRLQHRPRPRDAVAPGSRARTSATCSGWRSRSRAAGRRRSPSG